MSKQQPRWLVVLQIAAGLNMLAFGWFGFDGAPHEEMSDGVLLFDSAFHVLGAWLLIHVYRGMPK